MALFDDTQPFAAVVIADQRTLVWLGVRYYPGDPLTMPTAEAERYAELGVVAPPPTSP